MSDTAKKQMTRDYALARIARALGVAGYSVEECDALMEWLTAERPAASGQPNRIACGGCGGTGRRPTQHPNEVKSGEESLNGMTEQTAMLVQGICLACRGRGWQT